MRLSQLSLQGLCAALLLTAGLTRGAAASETFSCGAASVEIGFVKRPTTKAMDAHVEAVLSVSAEGRATVLRYDGAIDFIGATCAANARNAPIVVFQAYCGGSACRDQDNWGIVDPQSLLVRLVPNDWNRADARKILGKPLPTIPRMVSLSDEAARLGVP